MSAEELTSRDRYDVVVVGGRCAGAGTALLLARAGARVLLVDRGRQGDDTLSTHALMRGGVLQLARWGVLPAVVDAGTPSVTEVSFAYGGERIDLPIKARAGVGALYAPRRTIVDSLLVDAARTAGAEVRHQRIVDGLVRDAAGRVRGVALRTATGERAAVAADLVVGADGVASTVAAWVDAEREHEGRSACSIVYGHFPIGREAGYRWYYERGLAAGVIPTNDGHACIFVAMKPERYRAEARADRAGAFRAVLEEVAPDAAARIAGTAPAGPFFAFPGLPGFLRRAHGDGWALVGDAGSFRDPLTAHGMTDALRDAELLARAITGADSGGLAGYQRIRDELSLPLLRLSDEIGSLAWELPELKRLHRALNEQMNREVEHIAGLAPAPPFAA